MEVPCNTLLWAYEPLCSPEQLCSTLTKVMVSLFKQALPYIRKLILTVYLVLDKNFKTPISIFIKYIHLSYINRMFFLWIKLDTRLVIIKEKILTWIGGIFSASLQPLDMHEPTKKGLNYLKYPLFPTTLSSSL